MKQVRYSIPYLALLCVVFLVLIAAGSVMIDGAAGENLIIGYGFLLVGLWSLPGMVRYLFSGGLILEYDHAFVTFHGVLRSTTLPWSEVRQVEVKGGGGGSMQNHRFLKLRGPFTFYGHASLAEQLLARKHRPLESLQEELLEMRDKAGAGAADPLRTAAAFARDRAANAAPTFSQNPAPTDLGAMPDTRSSGVIGEIPESMPVKRGFFGRKT